MKKTVSNTSKINFTKKNIFFNLKGDTLTGLKKNDNCFDKFEEIYFSKINYLKIKGPKKHKKMLCNFLVPVGSVKFLVFDNFFNVVDSIILNKKNYGVLTIPKKNWFAFKGVSQETSLIVNIANKVHDDKEVIENLDVNIKNLF